MIPEALFTRHILELMLVTISAYIVVKTGKTRGAGRQGTRIFSAFAAANLVFQLAFLCSVIYREEDYLTGIAAGCVIYILLLVSMSAASYFWFLYVEEAVGSKRADTANKKLLWALPAAVFAVLCLVSVRTGWIFTFNEDGKYEIGSLFFLQYVFCFGYCALAMLSSGMNYFRARTKRDADRILFLIMIVDLAAAVIQLVYMENMMPVAMTLTLLLSYMNVYSVEVRQMKDSLEQERISLRRRDEESRILAENNARLFALEDNFESLYDVELESGRYTALVRGDFYQSNVINRLVRQTDYFEDLRANIDAVICEEDREGLYNALTRGSIRRELSANEHFDYYYRLRTDGGPVWFRIRVVYKDAARESIIIGVFNASEEMAAKEKEAAHLKNTELQLRHERLRGEILDRMLEYDDDPIEILKGYAERVRALIGCDQLIYRDLEETRIMVNSDAIAETWSVPMEYCSQCQHFDAHHPMYKDGYTEMSNCRKGWHGIPVYEKCPIKSSLTRIVYCDGETAGYLAIHYVQDYHRFTNLERETTEMFARILSISISRYRAKSENRELKLIREMQAQIEESLTFTNFFLNTFVSAYYVDLDSLTCQVYKRTDELEKAYPISSDYMTSLIEYINTDVHPEDRDMLLTAVRPDEMKELLKEKPEYSHIFRDLSGGGEKVYRMQVIRGTDENHAAFGFIDITAEVREQEERLEEAEEANDLISSIAASYNVAYAVNMKTDAFRLLRMDESVIGYGETFSCFSEARDYFIALLPETDRERMRRELDYDTVRQKLANAESYSVEYRVPINGAMIWHEMNVTVIDREKEHVAVGFAKKDIEITQKHLEERRFSEYFALYEIDIDSGMMKIVKDSPYYGLDRSGTAMPFSPAMLSFASGLDEEPRAFFERFADLSYAKKQFASEDKLTYAYRSNNVGDKSWVDCTCYVTLRHADGSPAMFTFGFSLIDSLGVYRQELQQKYIEQNAVLVSQQEQLKDARDAAESANRSKTDFLFSMSHDIRTPMNAIMGFTNMAIKHIDDREKAVDCLEKSQKAGAMLLSLINSVLEVSRIESGRAVLEEQPGDIYYSFANIENTMRELADTKDIRLTFDFGSITDRYVYADFGRCMRVFVNIISNAVKYTPEGGRVSVVCEQLSAASGGRAVYRYTFADNGIGMSEEFQKHIFEQFSREQTSTVSGIQGSGLGMSVVKSFVELMGGTVGVKSRQGEGSVFTIDLPLRLQEKHEYTDPLTGELVSDAPEEKPGETDFRGRRVLLAEDNELNREIAIEILEEAGLTVEDADDGTTALELLRQRGPKYYDFILMDIQMPIMNGYEATKRIRELYPDCHIPVIALSANAFAEDRAASAAAGMDDHVAKPINIRELFGVLAKYI